MALDNPLNCIILVLCLITGGNVLGLFEIKQALAVSQVQQDANTATGHKVEGMNNMLIRVDANVGILLGERYPNLKRESNANQVNNEVQCAPNIPTC